jgi:hypothetical protein
MVIIFCYGIFHYGCVLQWYSFQLVKLSTVKHFLVWLGMNWKECGKKQVWPNSRYNFTGGTVIVYYICPSSWELNGNYSYLIDITNRALGDNYNCYQLLQLLCHAFGINRTETSASGHLGLSQTKLNITPQWFINKFTTSQSQFTLWPTISLGVRRPSGTRNQFFFLLEILF